MTTSQKCIKYIDQRFMSELTYPHNTIETILETINADSYAFRRRALVPDDVWQKAFREYAAAAHRAYPQRSRAKTAEPHNNNRRP